MNGVTREQRWLMNSAGFLLAMLFPLLLIGCGKKPEPSASSGSVTPEPESQAVEPTKEAATKEAATSATGDASSNDAPASTTPSPSQSAETGDALGELKLRFEYGGDAPAPAPITMAANVAFCGQFKNVSERLLVDPESKGIKNVILYVYTGRGGSELPQQEPSSETRTLANQNCRFEPHILITQAGDTLRVTNVDQVGHNTNLSFFSNKPENPTIPPGEEKSFPLKLSEPAPIPVDCNIHPWMHAYLMVLDHPFVAVSDNNGELSIGGLPVGQKLVFRAFHEAGSISKVTINGQETEWRRSRFEVELHPGINDMGTVVLPADALSAD